MQIVENTASNFISNTKDYFAILKKNISNLESYTQTKLRQPKDIQRYRTPQNICHLATVDCDQTKSIINLNR